MVRNYIKRTNRGTISEDIYKNAAAEVSSKESSLRNAAEKYQINFMTLQRYIKKQSNLPLKPYCKLVGYAKNKQIFSDELESTLSNYLVHCSRIYYGLTPSDVKVLAYEYAKLNNVAYPKGWDVHKIASKDWFTNFLKRNHTLSLRLPEATSLGRITSFNRHNVAIFFDNLHSLYVKHNFEGHRVWNVDETGVTTVQKPKKIVAEKGKKQVGRSTSGERGTTVTMVFAVNAIGNSLPPMLIFPRVNFKQHFVNNGPSGCIGASHPSGWVTASSFLMFVQHFHKHVKCSPSSPVLLILDNHISHLSITVVDFCKENGIVLLSFPPHTTNNLQPLDVSVYGPFKTFYNNSASGWMDTHPGIPISIYDIPLLVKESLPLSATPKNITSGFTKTGIWPFNRNVFTDEDYMCSEVTDRPINDTVAIELSTTTDNNIDHTLIQHLTPNTPQCVQPSTSGHTIVTPEDIRPLPKAGERRNNRTRKKMKSTILTDTPEKEKLRLEQEARDEKNKKKDLRSKRKLDFNKTKTNEKSSQKPKTKKHKSNTVDSEEEEDDDYFCIICLGAYSKSRKGEDWVECCSCKKWAHDKCAGAGGLLFYNCKNCSSDLDEDFEDTE